MTTAPLFIPGSAGEYFGQVLHTREAVFRESRYPGSLRMPMHYHPRPYFSYVAGGGIRERDARGEHEYGPGSVHFHPAGDPHAGRMGADGTTCLSVILAGELAARLGTPSAARFPRLEGSPAARLARGCHRELRATDSASDLALEALALEPVATLLRAPGPRERGTPRWLLDVRDHLHAHFLERVRRAELSALADIHEVHLVRAFRRRFGATPGAYVRRLRVDHACRALLDPDVSVAELALAAGFASQAHFTRVFHRLVGTTPAAYRRARPRRRS